MILSRLLIIKEDIESLVDSSWWDKTVAGLIELFVELSFDR